MKKSQNKIQPPEEALKLLPWYATGWLSLPEREYMQKVLSQYPEFQTMLDAERKMISAIEDDKTILDQSCLEPTSVRLEAVLEQLSREEDKVTTKPKQGFIQSLSQLFSGYSPKIQYAAFATITTLTFALLFAFVAPLVDEKTGGDTIFYPATYSMQKADSSITALLIGLNTKPNDPRLLKLLRENNATIDLIAGKNGMYRFSLPNKLNAEQTNNLLNKLTNDKELFWFAGEEF